jgi:hypothetical protein
MAAGWDDDDVVRRLMEKVGMQRRCALRPPREDEWWRGSGDVVQRWGTEESMGSRDACRRRGTETKRFLV